MRQFRIVRAIVSVWVCVSVCVALRPPLPTLCPSYVYTHTALVSIQALTLAADVVATVAATTVVEKTLITLSTLNRLSASHRSKIEHIFFIPFVR